MCPSAACASLCFRYNQRIGGGWDTIKWKQNLYEIMNIEIARSNYAMLMERTLPPMAA